MGNGSDRRGNLSDDLMALGEREPRPSAGRTIRWRQFSLLRWIGFALLIAGGSVLFSSTWWAGILIGFTGLVLLWNDNEKLRRCTDEHSD